MPAVATVATSTETAVRRNSPISSRNCPGASGALASSPGHQLVAVDEEEVEGHQRDHQPDDGAAGGGDDAAQGREGLAAAGADQALQLGQQLGQRGDDAAAQRLEPEREAGHQPGDPLARPAPRAATGRPSTAWPAMTVRSAATGMTSTTMSATTSSPAAHSRRPRRRATSQVMGPRSAAASTAATSSEVQKGEISITVRATEVTTRPMYIVTPEEALANEKEGVTSTKTWRWKAGNVRDFAWASSRKFIWDAMGVKQDEGSDVLAQSFFPTEADPLWSQYSTRAVAHTIDVYSEFSFPYPYPNAISVNTWAGGGMEYPMISFNGYRPVKDEKTGVKTYTRRARDGLVGVVIHEVGHNYFPMIVNSDERQWTWMDEGLNSFLEFMAELRWDEKFPVLNNNSNSLDEIGAYMMSEDQVPIMTNSESVVQFGNNAYNKPAAALTVLRETVMGRELFDYAFKQYAQRWKFKRPTPSDFFRTMEDASGVDLDWFWRGWFYTTDHVDVALSDVREYRLSTKDPDVEGALRRERQHLTRPEPVTVTDNRDAGQQTYMQKHPDAADFYTENDEFEPTNKDRNDYQSWLEGLKEPDRSTFTRALKENPYIYFMDFQNLGGLVSPLPLRFTFEDGTTKDVMVPAEIWRVNNEKVSKMFVETKKVVSVELDARHQIADAVRANNSFPQKNVPSRMDVFRSTQSGTRNQMADALVELKAKQQPAGAAAPIAPSN